MVRRSNPIPPVSRLENNSQIRSCARLRRALRRILDSMFAPHYRAYASLKAHAVELDLEKYFDIYEISRIDMEDAAVIATTDLVGLEAADTLQDLRLGAQKLHVVKKMILCTLLALNADGGQSDFPRWSAAIEAMKDLSLLMAKMVAHMDKILDEEEGELFNLRQ